MTASFTTFSVVIINFLPKLLSERSFKVNFPLHLPFQLVTLILMAMITTRDARLTRMERRRDGATCPICCWRKYLRISASETGTTPAWRVGTGIGRST